MAILNRVGSTALERLQIVQENIQKKNEQLMRSDSQNENTSVDTTTTTTLEEENEEDEEPKKIDNVMSYENNIKRYGVRQEILIKSDKQDAFVKAKMMLSEHSKPEETIEVECLGDIDYRVGFGIHVYLPFLPKYYDCLMYVKEVEHEWKRNGLFVSKLTVTPSRVMDEKEWSDITDSEDDDSTGSNSELWQKIYAVLKQQIGKPYVWGAHGSESFDCSGLVEYCYNQFKDEIGETIGWTTYEQKSNGKSVGKDLSQAQEGDLLLWSGNGSYPPPAHVSVYVGNNQMIHAPHTGDVVKIVTISRNDIYDIRRVLPEIVSGYIGGDVDIPQEYLNTIKSGVESNVSTFLKNMDNYGYKNNLITICKKYNIDPYTMAGIICIESEGNPVCGTGSYKGLCQTEGGSSDPATNIKQGCEMYNQKCEACGNASVQVALSCYNSGEGTVINACKASGLDMKTCSVKQLGDALKSYVSSHNPSWNSDEKKYYASKVLYAISLLKGKNALD